MIEILKEMKPIGEIVEENEMLSNNESEIAVVNNHEEVTIISETGIKKEDKEIGVKVKKKNSYKTLNIEMKNGEKIGIKTVVKVIDKEHSKKIMENSFEAVERSVINMLTQENDKEKNNVASDQSDEQIEKLEAVEVDLEGLDISLYIENVLEMIKTKRVNISEELFRNVLRNIVD
jgi:hypothetical protein